MGGHRKSRRRSPEPRRRHSYSDEDSSSSSRSSYRRRRRRRSSSPDRRHVEKAVYETKRRLRDEFDYKVDQLVEAKWQKLKGKSLETLIKEHPDLKSLVEEHVKIEVEKMRQVMKEEIEAEKLEMIQNFQAAELASQNPVGSLDDLLAMNEEKIKAEQERLAAEEADRNEQRFHELAKKVRDSEEMKSEDKIESTAPPCDKKHKIRFRLSDDFF